MGLPTIALLAVVGNLPVDPAIGPSTVDPARYYVLLFGGQGERWRPRTAHTWATYVRATPQSGGTIRVEAFTISWLPATLDVRPLRLRPEPGENLTLHQTLDHMATGRQKVSLWGPFETAAASYWDAARYKQVLDSGAIRYRVFDGREGRVDVNHCVHAVVRADPALDAATDPILSFGPVITQRVANAMAKVGVVAEPAVTHDWLIPALGIDRYDVDRQPVGQRPVRLLLPSR